MRVVVTGATGRTGSLVVEKLAKKEGTEVVACVRGNKTEGFPENVNVAKGCQITGENAEQKLTEAFSGADSLIILTSAVPKLNKLSLFPVIFGKMFGSPKKPSFYFEKGEEPKNVDYEGQLLQIKVAKAVGIKHCVLISSLGGTSPEHFLNKNMDNMVLWKRKSEIELIDSGLDYTIIKPGGLLPHFGSSSEKVPGGERHLVVGVDDVFLTRDARTIPREDLAEICVEALTSKAAINRSFDLVSDPPGQGTAYQKGDLDALLETLQGKNCKYDDAAALANLS